MPENFY